MHARIKLNWFNNNEAMLKELILEVVRTTNLRCNDKL